MKLPKFLSEQAWYNLMHSQTHVVLLKWKQKIIRSFSSGVTNQLIRVKKYEKKEKKNQLFHGLHFRILRELKLDHESIWVGEH